MTRSRYECVDVFDPETSTMQSVIRPRAPAPRKKPKKAPRGSMLESLLERPSRPGPVFLAARFKL